MPLLYHMIYLCFILICKTHSIIVYVPYSSFHLPKCGYCALRPMRGVSGGSSRIQETPRFQRRPWFF